MNADGTNEFLAFRCPECGKRLKVARRHAGKQVSCPRCGERIEIPTESAPRTESGARSPAGPAAQDAAGPARPPQAGTPPFQIEPVRTLSPGAEDELLQLGSPAITDVDRRVQESQQAKAARMKEQEEGTQRRPAPKAPVGAVEPVPVQRSAPRRRPADEEAPLPLDDDAPPSPVESVQPQAEPAGTDRSRRDEASRSPSDAPPHRSAFDDDLPELASLEEVVRKKELSEEEILAAHLRAGGDDRDVDDDVLDLMDDELPSLLDTGVRKRKSDGVEEYRVICPTCGTGQYVPFSAVGMKVKCPDCFSQFKVPRPPEHLLSKKKKTTPSYQDDDVPRIREEPPERDTSDRLRKGRTKEMLSRAAQELTEEQQDELYRMEFDTAGFMRRTFGFLTDVVVVSQIIGYGLVFALLFGLIHFSLLDTESWFGRGLLLISFVLAPLATMLFALPMFSGGLLLIESVANKQPKQEALPSFNIFDNFGELLVLGVSIATSAAPGFILGGLVLGDEAAIYGRLMGSMLSSVLLFPIILLSMLEGGSITSVVTTNVLLSLSKAPQAWGAYYLKIFSGYVVMGLLWMMLIGRNPAATALIGATMPLLFFFTCQQLGLLADDISDELAVEVESGDGDKEAEEGEETGDLAATSAQSDLEDLEQ